MNYQQETDRLGTELKAELTEPLLSLIKEANLIVVKRHEKEFEAHFGLTLESCCDPVLGLDLHDLCVNKLGLLYDAGPSLHHQVAKKYGRIASDCVETIITAPEKELHKLLLTGGYELVD